jgi:hypothetical protein
LKDSVIVLDESVRRHGDLKTAPIIASKKDAASVQARDDLRAQTIFECADEAGIALPKSDDC